MRARAQRPTGNSWKRQPTWLFDVISSPRTLGARGVFPLLLLIALALVFGCESGQPDAKVRGALVAFLRYEDESLRIGREAGARGEEVNIAPWSWAWREGQGRFLGGVYADDLPPRGRQMNGRIEGRLSKQEMLEYFRCLSDGAYMRAFAAKNGFGWLVDKWPPEDLAGGQVSFFFVDKENRRVLGLKLLDLVVSLPPEAGGGPAFGGSVLCWLEEYVSFPTGTPEERYVEWFEQHRAELRWVEEKGVFALP